MHAFLRDLTWGYRALRATPATALAAVLAIALGTGANTAVFAVAYGVLLRPLPCPEPSRIVVVTLHVANGKEFAIPLTEMEEWQRSVRSFEATGAYSVTELTMRGIGEPRLVRTGLVTPSFFDVFRVAPRAGRAPSAADPDQWMILGSRLAEQPSRSGQGTAGLLGRPVTVGDHGFEVSAVMAPEFAFPEEDVAAWVPAAPLSRLQMASGREVPRRFRLMARLKVGVSVEQARDDAQRALSGLASAKKDAFTARVRTLDDVLFGKVRPVLNALVVAAILVLLVACGNVATLLVSRAVARNRDLAVRLSLGASSWQLARGVLAESLRDRGRGLRAGDRTCACVGPSVRPHGHGGRSAAGRDCRRSAGPGRNRARRRRRHAHLRARARRPRRALGFRPGLQGNARERFPGGPPDAPRPHRRPDLALDRAPQRCRPDRAHGVRAFVG